jgi:hypothetical protein
VIPDYITVTRPGIWVRHNSAYPWGITVRVNSVNYELSGPGNVINVPMVAASEGLCIWECVGADCRWDCAYTVFDNHHYRVIDAPGGQQWDLSLVSD